MITLYNVIEFSDASKEIKVLKNIQEHCLRRAGMNTEEEYDTSVYATTKFGGYSLLATAKMLYGQSLGPTKATVKEHGSIKAHLERVVSNSTTPPAERSPLDLLGPLVTSATKSATGFEPPSTWGGDIVPECIIVSTCDLSDGSLAHNPGTCYGCLQICVFAAHLTFAFLFRSQLRVPRPAVGVHVLLAHHDELVGTRGKRTLRPCLQSHHPLQERLPVRFGPGRSQHGTVLRNRVQTTVY